MLVEIVAFMPIYSAKADIVNTFAQVQCLEELNALKIDMFNANGEMPRQTAKNDYEALWKNKGLVLAEALIEYDPNFKWQNTKSLQMQ